MERIGYMSESGKKTLTTILLLAAFALCIALVVVGQRNVGAPGLLVQLLGVAGLMALLWNYNRHFR